MKCPCENCIVFVMCKLKLMKKYENQVVQLSTTCPYLGEYLNKAVTGDVTHTVIARKTFGLMDWGPSRYQEYKMPII